MLPMLPQPAASLLLYIPPRPEEASPGPMAAQYPWRRIANPSLVGMSSAASMAPPSAQSHSSSSNTGSGSGSGTTSAATTAAALAASASGPGLGPNTTTNAAADNVDDISIGLELKFVLLGLPLGELQERRSLDDSEQARQRRAYTSIARAIERMGERQRAVAIHEVHEAGRQECEFWPTHWIVKKANSVELARTDPKPDGRNTDGRAVPVEMSSPKMAWFDKFAQLRARKVIAGLQRPYNLHVNYTCDVHVHIGRRDGAGFSLLTLKKLATVLWLAEPTLRSIRNPASPNFKNVYTWGAELRNFSRLATAVEKHGDLRQLCTGDNDDEFDQYVGMPSGGDTTTPGLGEALRAIWRAASPLELGTMLSGPQRQFRRLGFNFSAFGEEDERSRRGPRTIEFRILEGTLKTDEIFGWVHICCKLAELAMKGRQSQFRDVIRHLLQEDRDRALAARLSGTLGGSVAAAASLRLSPPLSSPDFLFGALMDRMGIDAAIYRPLQQKIRKDYGLYGRDEDPDSR